MFKKPLKPEDVFSNFSADYRQAFQKDLESIILFGSGARGDYIPGRSDLNFLIVLSEEGMMRLDTLSALTAKWRKSKVATPLFMSEGDIMSSIDAYPVEFLNIKRHYRTIFGKDVMAAIEFDPTHLRLQCERELKGKSLLLLERYTEAEGNTKKIQQLIAESITAFLSIFRALLYLKGIEAPSGKRDLVRITAEHYGIDIKTFLKSIDVKDGILKFSNEEIKGLFHRYVKEVRTLTREIDKLGM